MRPTDSAMRWRRYRRGGSCPRAIPWRHVEGACGRGCARAPMVLGPFAETKGSRRAGAKPRKTLPLVRTASVIQKQSELVQNRERNFMPPSEFMPGHGEPMLDQGVLELDSGVVRK